MARTEKEPTRLPWLGVGIGAAALIAAAAGLAFLAPRPANDIVVSTPESVFAQLGRNVADVRLVNGDGENVRWGDLGEAPRAVFFGFTHCPEICPTTVAELDRALDAIGPEADAIKIDFVSIDPARDTPETLKTYFSSFDRPIRAFTGEETEIRRLTEAFRASYRRTPVGEDDYTMDHTTLVYLLNAEGAVIDAVVYGAPPEHMTGQLRALITPDADGA